MPDKYHVIVHTYVPQKGEWGKFPDKSVSNCVLCIAYGVSCANLPNPSPTAFCFGRHRRSDGQNESVTRCDAALPWYIIVGKQVSLSIYAGLLRHVPS